LSAAGTTDAVPPPKKYLKLNAGYPHITDALALALKWPSVTLSSDVYTFWPGGQIYQQNIDLLQDQFVYGSAYPFGNFKETLEQTKHSNKHWHCRWRMK